MRARNVSVSIIPHEGGLKVWCASFTLPVTIPRGKDGLVDAQARAKLEKAIASVIGEVDFSGAPALTETDPV